MPDPIITVTPTIMDGQVVRWYEDEQQASYRRPTLSASRNGVRVDGYLNDIPGEWLTAAEQARVDLAAGRDVAHLATHSLKMLSGELTPITRDVAHG